MPDNQTPALPEDIFDEPNAPAASAKPTAAMNQNQAAPAPKPLTPVATNTAPTAPATTAPTVFDDVMAPASHGSRLWLWIFLGVVVVGIAGAVYFWWLAPVLSPTDVGLDAVESAAGTNAPAPIDNTVPATNEIGAVTTDADSDGLPDSEEQRIGTDPAKVDTDEDGLTDHEEITFYGTDPLQADTDGDSYLDGTEVRNGYNPKGEGKLFTIPTESDSPTASGGSAGSVTAPAL